MLAEEITATASSGYRLEMDCGHFDDPGRLLSQIQEEMRAAIARPFQKTNELGGLDLTGDELEGYVEDDPDAENRGLPRVLIDGRSVTWEELGILLSKYTGWSFRLRVGGNLPSRVAGGLPGLVEVRPPTSAEFRAAFRAVRRSPRTFIIDSGHYPTPQQL